MVMYCDASPSVYTCVERTARKPHHCCECKAPILKGERYCYTAGKWEFGFAVYRQHLVCEHACEAIRDDFGGDCIGFGSLKEEFDEIRTDSWYPEHDHYKSAWQRLRSLMAKILWRERAAKKDRGGK
jgi:hypothetical protein